MGTAASLLGHSPEVMLRVYRKATKGDMRDALAWAADLVSGQHGHHLAPHLTSRQHGHHIGQRPQYLPGHVLRVLEGSLGGLLLGGVGAVADLHRIGRREAGL